MIVHQSTALQVTIAVGTHKFTKNEFAGLIAKLHEAIDSGDVDVQMTSQFGVLGGGNVEPLPQINANGKLTTDFLDTAYNGVKTERDKAVAAHPNRAQRRAKPKAGAKRNGRGEPARATTTTTAPDG